MFRPLVVLGVLATVVAGAPLEGFLEVAAGSAAEAAAAGSGSGSAAGSGSGSAAGGPVPPAAALPTAPAAFTGFAPFSGNPMQQQQQQFQQMPFMGGMMGNPYAGMNALVDGRFGVGNLGSPFVSSVPQFPVPGNPLTSMVHPYWVQQLQAMRQAQMQFAMMSGAHPLYTPFYHPVVGASLMGIGMGLNPMFGGPINSLALMASQSGRGPRWLARGYSPRVQRRAWRKANRLLRWIRRSHRRLYRALMRAHIRNTKASFRYARRMLRNHQRWTRKMMGAHMRITRRMLRAYGL